MGRPASSATAGARATWLSALAVYGSTALLTLGNFGIARWLPSRADLGLYSTAVAAGSLLSSILGFGIERSLTLRASLTSDGSAQRALHDVHTRAILLRLLLIGSITVIWGSLGATPGHLPTLLAFAAAASAIAVQSRIDMLFAREDRERATAALLTFRGATLLGIASLPFLPDGIRLTVFVWWQFVLVAAAGFLLESWSRPQAPDEDPSTVSVGDAFSAARAYWALPIAAFLYVQGDVLVLACFREIDEVGTYRVAYLIASSAVLGYHAVQLAWLPRLARSAVSGGSTFTETSTRFAQSAFAAVVAGLSLAAIANSWVVRTWLPRYEDALPLIPILLMAHLAYYAPPYGDMFHALGRPGLVTRIALATAVLNVVLNFVLIPPFGTTGAAAATLLSFCALRALYTYASRRLDPSWCSRAGRLRLAILALVAMLFIAGAAGVDYLRAPTDSKHVQQNE